AGLLALGGCASLTLARESVTPGVLAPGEFGFDCLDDGVDRGRDGASVITAAQPGELVAQAHRRGGGEDHMGGKHLVALPNFAACAAVLVWATSAVPTNRQSPGMRTASPCSGAVLYC